MAFKTLSSEKDVCAEFFRLLQVAETGLRHKLNFFSLSQSLANRRDTQRLGDEGEATPGGRQN